MKYGLIFYSLLCFLNIPAAWTQSVSITPTAYYVDQILSYGKGITCTLNASAEFTGAFEIWYVPKQNSTLRRTVFKSNFEQGVIGPVAEWFDDKERVIRHVEFDTSMRSKAYTVLLYIPSGFALPAKVFPTSSKIYVNGILCQEDEFEGGRVSRRKIYHESGKLRSESAMQGEMMNFRGGIPDFDLMWKQHGVYTGYREDGSVQETGFYENGKPSKTWVEYYKNGTEMSRKVYAENEKLIVRTYDKSGSLQSYYTQHKGQYQGTYRTFYPTGKLQTTTRYGSSGSRDSALVTYYPNGQVKSSYACCLTGGNVEVVDGALGKYDVYTEWYESGNVKVKGAFGQYGEEVGKWKYFNQNGKLDSIVDMSAREELLFEMVDYSAPDDQYEGFLGVFSRNSPISATKLDLPALHAVTGNFPVKANPLLKGFKKNTSATASIRVFTDATFEVLPLTGMDEKTKVQFSQFLKENWRWALPMKIDEKSVVCVVDLAIAWIPKD